MIDARGPVVHQVASNRAGFAYCAADDGNLLLANGTKTIEVVSSTDLSLKPRNASGAVDNTAAATTKAKPAIASRVWIKNSSGVRVSLIISVAQDENGNLIDNSRNRLYLEQGEEITLFERIVRIKENNESATVAQTGLGVRYYFMLEPNHRF